MPLHPLFSRIRPFHGSKREEILALAAWVRSPESFVEALRASRLQGEDTTVIISTGNVAFVITRMMLFLGYFHYGARGILDLTHTRLFTFRTLRELFEQAGYEIEEVRGIPAPFPLALGDTALGAIPSWV